MSDRCDVAVVGLGVHGSSLVHELALRGCDVIGIDARTPPHECGSSTGRTRITREAYYEHPAYVPLAQRANEIWTQLEELSGAVLYRRTGGLMCGSPDGELIRGTLRSCAEHELEHELLDDASVRARFAGLAPPAGTVGVLEREAGVLMLDGCLRTLHELAAGYGARLRYDCAVTSWLATADGVALHTTCGELHAGTAVLAAGPWLNAVLAMEQRESRLRLDLAVERQTSHWYMPTPGNHSLRAESCPITMLERADGLMLYTLPDVGHGVKAGLHHGGAIVDPDQCDRTISFREEQRMRALVEEWLPGGAHREVHAAVCLYTNTPDRHFAIGRHPAHDNVLLVSACSGHGFKFGPALAEVVADVLLEGDEPDPLFRLERVIAAH